MQLNLQPLLPYEVPQRTRDCALDLEAADQSDFQLLVDIWRDRLVHAETPEA